MKLPGNKIVVAIDPGRSKCGIAVVEDADADVLHRAVVLVDEIPKALADICACYSVDVILIGNGTAAANIEAIANELDKPIEIVDEKFTSIEARKRFFLENPPRGIRRLLPTSFQTPNRPYDDYVAVILAERYLASL